MLNIVIRLKNEETLQIKLIFDAPICKHCNLLKEEENVHEIFIGGR